MVSAGAGCGVDLYWLPLGAGGHSVRLNGRIFEAAVALRDRRPRFDLYHSALVVRLPEGPVMVETGLGYRVRVALAVPGSAST